MREVSQFQIKDDVKYGTSKEGVAVPMLFPKGIADKMENLKSHNLM